MAGESPSLVVKVEANLDGLRQGMQQTQMQIQTTQQNVEKLATSFSGEKIISQANDVTAAIGQIGGATKLTAEEQLKVNSILTEGLTKYQALGVEAPAAMRELAAATAPVQESMGMLEGMVTGFIAAMSVEKVIQFVGAIISAGDRLQTLHDRT